MSGPFKNTSSSSSSSSIPLPLPLPRPPPPPPPHRPEIAAGSAIKSAKIPTVQHNSATTAAGTTASSSAPPATISSILSSLDRDFLSSASLGASASAAASPSSAAHMARLQTHFANLAPACTTHLTDQNAVPILSTCTNNNAASSLSSLSTAFVQAHDTASRMGLGKPLRVTLSMGSGVAVIQTGILPEKDDDDGSDDDNDEHNDDAASRSRTLSSGGESSNVMLVGTVVAPEDRLAEARIASWGVEDVARKLQKYMHEVK